MKFVEELVVSEYLPTVRSMLAESLRDRGYTQSETAATLGISQSAVSKYAHGEVSRNEQVLTDERTRETVERVSEGLASGDMSRVAALIELEVAIRESEQDGVLARLHEAAMPELAETESTYAVHDPDGELRVRERTLASLRRGLRELQNDPGFGALIPNVGSNLVEATPDATTLDDVAAVPGRIFEVKGRTTVPADPEFGVSGHVAGVLLAARRAGSTARAAVNVRYEDRIVERLAELGHEPVAFDADGGPDAVERALAERTVPETVAVYQTGDVGIEPIVYVLGPDAATVAGVVGQLP